MMNGTYWTRFAAARVLGKRNGMNGANDAEGVNSANSVDGANDAGDVNSMNGGRRIHRHTRRGWHDERIDGWPRKTGVLATRHAAQPAGGYSMMNGFCWIQFTAARVLGWRNGMDEGTGVNNAKGVDNVNSVNEANNADGMSSMKGTSNANGTEGVKCTFHTSGAKVNFRKYRVTEKRNAFGRKQSQHLFHVAEFDWRGRRKKQAQKVQRKLQTQRKQQIPATSPAHPPHRPAGDERHKRQRHCYREQGIALPVVLLLASMMLALAAAWFESSLMATRSASGIVEHLRAFHAADGALAHCARALVTGALPMPVEAAEPGEPGAWRRASLFDAQAVTPASVWPGSVRPPQCLIEAWRIGARPAARAFLLTARGFGSTGDAQSWLQLQLVVDGKNVEYHWRRVVARPL